MILPAARLQGTQALPTPDWHQESKHEFPPELPSHFTKLQVRKMHLTGAEKDAK